MEYLLVTSKDFIDHNVLADVFNRHSKKAFLRSKGYNVIIYCGTKLLAIVSLNILKALTI